jgi:hypothetical protein
MIFARYILVMRYRVPKHKERLFQRAPELLQKITTEVEEEILELQKQHPEKTDLLEKRLQELKNPSPERKQKLFEDVWLQNIIVDPKRSSFQALSAMTWQFVTPKLGEQLFVTSDNPVFHFEWMGIGKPMSEVTFPISKNIALWATWRTDLREDFVTVRTQFVKEINRRTLKIARNFVYSANAESWIANLLNNQEKIRLNPTT